MLSMQLAGSVGALPVQQVWRRACWQQRPAGRESAAAGHMWAFSLGQAECMPAIRKSRELTENRVISMLLVRVRLNACLQFAKVESWPRIVWSAHFLLGQAHCMPGFCKSTELARNRVISSQQE